MDYGEPDDIEKEFVKQSTKIQRLENLVRELIKRIQELEDAVYNGPNSQVMIDAKNDFEKNM